MRWRQFKSFEHQNELKRNRVFRAASLNVFGDFSEAWNRGLMLNPWGCMVYHLQIFDAPTKYSWYKKFLRKVDGPTFRQKVSLNYKFHPQQKHKKHELYQVFHDNFLLTRCPWFFLPGSFFGWKSLWFFSWSFEEPDCSLQTDELQLMERTNYPLAYTTKAWTWQCEKRQWSFDGQKHRTGWWQLKYFLFSSLFGEDSHFY